MTNNQPQISIVIPTFNEEDRIGGSLEKLADFLNNRQEEFEVIVVDDASTDNTKKVAESFAAKIPNLKVIRLEKSPYMGKGLAVNKGVLAAKGDIVLFTDVDFSTPIEEIDKLLDKASQGFDVLIGSRALNRSLVRKRQNPLRELMGRTFNILVQNLASLRGIVDTQCGFKAFKMPACRSLFEEERIFDFGFDVELLYLAKKKGLKIAEVPILWYNDPRSTVSPVKDSISMFLDLFKIRMYHADRNGSLLDKFFYFAYRYRTFWRFAVVGVSNTTVDYGLFVLLTRLADFDPLAANPIAVEVAIVWSFTWNSLWTFAERSVEKPVWLRFFVFQFVSFGALVLSQISLLLLNKFFGVYDLLAKGVTIPLVLAFNYLLNSRWTFRDITTGRARWYWYSVLIIFLLATYLFLTNLFATSFLNR